MKHEVRQQLEKCTCFMDGQVWDTSLSNVQVKMLQKMIGNDTKLSAKSKVDLARLPPCENSLIPYVHYRVACNKRVNEAIPENPKPYDAGHGWTRTEEGLVEPL